MWENPTNRAYVRTNTWSVTAKVSKDETAEEWFDALVLDMAAGGLLFLTDLTHDTGDELWFDILIDPMTPGIHGKIPMKAKGEVRGNRGMRNGMNSYSVAFTDISKSDKIRLDELVRKTISAYNADADDFLYR